MFDIDQEKRISFADIREHAVFREQFPEIAPKSRILYAQPFQSKIVKKSEEKLKKREFDIDTDIKHSMCIIRNKVAKFPLETVLLERKKDEIDFLRDNTEEFLETDTL